MPPSPLLNGGGGRREFRSHLGESSKNFWNPLSSSASPNTDPQATQEVREHTLGVWGRRPLSHFTSAGPGAGLGCEEDTDGLGGCPGGCCTSMRSAESRTEPRKSAQRRVRKSLGRCQSARHRAQPGEPEPCLPLSRAARPEHGGSWESAVSMWGQGNTKGKADGGQEESRCKRPIRAAPASGGELPGSARGVPAQAPTPLSSPGKSRRRTPHCGEWTLLAPGSHPSFIALLSTRIFPIPEVLRSRKCVQRGES